MNKDIVYIIIWDSIVNCIHKNTANGKLNQF